MTLTKKEACKLLGISPRTLERRMASGRYGFTRTGEGQFAELSFMHADLGLPEPPVPVIETAPATRVPAPELTSAPCPLSEIELRAQADERFAQDYRRGEATDSLGNKISGTNDSRPATGAVSLIGPSIDAKQRPAVDVQSHMQPALLQGGVNANDAQRWSFDKGLSDDELAIARSDWRRRHGGPSMSEQREAVERSKVTINDAFNFARRGR